MTYEASLTYDNNTVIRGNGVINTPQDLYTAIVKPELTHLILHKDFAEEYFTPSGLSDLVENIHRINPHCEVTIDADTTDFNMKAIRALSSYTSAEEVIYQLQAHPAEMMDVIHALCANYNNTYAETLVANNKVASLQLQNSELSRRLDDQASDFDRLLFEKSIVDAQLKTLVGRINYSYEKDIDTSQLLQIEGKARYSKILYIKERTRVRFVDTLLYYLQEILRTLYGVPARIVVIGPYYSYAGIYLYPGFDPSYNLSYTQLYNGDIYMPGFQPRVMEDVLKNPSNIEYLIILDRGGFDVPHVTGDRVEFLYTMSDLVDNYDRIDRRRVISYNHDSLYIPYIQGFDLMSSEEKMQRYSSMKIMKHLIEILEQR